MSTRTLRTSFKVDGVLTDVTSVVLSDPTGTFGVKRTDTGEIMVADGTAATHVGTGTYDYVLTEPAEGLTYQWYSEVVYLGITYRQEHASSPANAAPEVVTGGTALTTAVARLESAYAAACANPKPSYTITTATGGQTVGWTEYLESLRAQIEKLYEMINSRNPYAISTRHHV